MKRLVRKAAFFDALLFSLDHLIRIADDFNFVLESGVYDFNTDQLSTDFNEIADNYVDVIMSTGYQQYEPKGDSQWADIASTSINNLKNMLSQNQFSKSEWNNFYQAIKGAPAIVASYDPTTNQQ